MTRASSRKQCGYSGMLGALGRVIASAVLAVGLLPAGAIAFADDEAGPIIGSAEPVDLADDSPIDAADGAETTDAGGVSPKAAAPKLGADPTLIAGISFPPNPVETIGNPMNTKIDLFDYWVRDGEDGQFAADSPHDQWQSGDAEGGINKGHPLKFRMWDGDLGEGSNGGTANKYTGPYDAGVNDLPAPVLPGIVQKTLVDGYPALGENLVDNIHTHQNPSYQGGTYYDPDAYEGDIEGEGHSLAYLFDPTKENVAGRAAYPGVDHLFQVDEEGYYTFDSMVNGARYDPSSKDYVVGDPEDPEGTQFHGFWPFGTEDNRHYFGMHLQADFSQPEGGMVLNPSGEYKNMQYSFTGDDDVWVYIDGVLVGDLGGIHQPSSLLIDFHTGHVQVNNGEAAKNGYDKTLRELFREAGSPLADDDSKWDANGSFASGTYHHIDFFYMERGNTDSNMQIRYNMVSTGDFTAHKSLRRSAEDPVLKSGQFAFELIGNAGLYRFGDYDSSKSYRTWDSETEADFLGIINGEPTDSYRRALMPMASSRPEDATVAATDDQDIEVVPVAADGNVNFGTLYLHHDDEHVNGDVYLYQIREIVPDDAVKIIEGETVTYADATPEQRLEGGFMKDGVAYTGKVYYYAGIVSETTGEQGTEQWLAKVYLDKDPVTGEFTIDRETRFANFDNTYKPGVQLKAQKTLTGSKLAEGQFEFRAYADAECTVPAIDIYGKELVARNDAKGVVEFKRIELPEDEIADVAVGQSKTFEYYIKETIPEGAESIGDGKYKLGRMTYDGSVHKVVATYTLVSIDAETGESVYSVTTSYVNDNDPSKPDDPAHAAAFKNEAEVYQPFEIELEKELKNEDGEEIGLGGRTFTFHLREVDENGADVPDGLTLTATNNPDGTIEFSDEGMEFTSADFPEGVAEKTRYFRIVEDTTGTGSYTTPGGVTYDHVRNGVAYTAAEIPVTVHATYDAEAAAPISVDVEYDEQYSGFEARFVVDDASAGIGHIEVTLHDLDLSSQGGVVSISGAAGAPLPDSTTIAVDSPNGTFSSGPISFSSISDGKRTLNYTVSAADLSAQLGVRVDKSTTVSGVGNIQASWVPNENDPGKGHIHVDLEHAATGWYANVSVAGSQGAPTPNPSSIGVNNTEVIDGAGRATRSLDFGEVDLSSVDPNLDSVTYTVDMNGTKLPVTVNIAKEVRPISIGYSNATGNSSQGYDMDITATIPMSGTYRLGAGYWNGYMDITGPKNGEVLSQKLHIEGWQAQSGSCSLYLYQDQNTSLLTIPFNASAPGSASGSISCVTGTSSVPASISDYNEVAKFDEFTGGTASARKDTTVNDTFTNILLEEQASLTVEKKVSGAYGDKTKDFTFQVESLPEGVDKLSGELHRKAGGAEAVELDAEHLSFELADGDYITFSSLPSGSSLVVAEVEASGYQTKVTAPEVGTGTMITTDNASRKASASNLKGASKVLFENSIETVPDTGIAGLDGPWALLLGIVLLAAEIAAGAYLLRRRRIRRRAAR